MAAAGWQTRELNFSVFAGDPEQGVPMAQPHSESESPEAPQRAMI